MPHRGELQSPTAGSLSSALSVRYSNGVTTQTLTENMTGTGASAAVLTLSNPSFNYGSVIIGNSLDQSFTVTNTGGFRDESRCLGSECFV